MELSYKQLDLTYVKTVFEMEKLSYPPDEVATLEQVQMLLEYAPELFLGCFLNKALIGYITATRFDSFNMESMKQVNPDGALLGVHSVVVLPKYRGQGVATKMLQVYLSRLYRMNKRPRNKIKEVVLLTKPQKVGLYLGVGFICRGISGIKLGSEIWLDCYLPFNSEAMEKLFLKKVWASAFNQVTEVDGGYISTNIDFVPYYVVRTNTSLEKGLSRAVAVVPCYKNRKPIILPEYAQKIQRNMELVGYSLVVFVISEKDKPHYFIKCFQKGVEAGFDPFAVVASARVLFHTFSFRDSSKLMLQFGQNTEVEVSRSGSSFTSERARNFDILHLHIDQKEGDRILPVKFSGEAIIYASGLVRLS
eukprot:snap_masked-scaffold_84-processed-gene-0.25-mRNA-1 protein AED:1.00 eAED:1.00 QI:0/-1/0/0/-1/1/1/0/362